MSRHTWTLRNVDALPTLGCAFLSPWRRLVGTAAWRLLAEAALTVTGHLRRRPDPAAERALRTALTDFDEELAQILGDRTPRDRAS
jgi:hypothetical protein